MTQQRLPIHKRVWEWFASLGKEQARHAAARLTPKHFPIAYKLALIITLLITTSMVILGLVIVSSQTQLHKQQILKLQSQIVVDQ